MEIKYTGIESEKNSDFLNIWSDKMENMKMCPLRKQTVIDGSRSIEEFMPCIKEKCSWWIRDENPNMEECVIINLVYIANPA